MQPPGAGARRLAAERAGARASLARAAPSRRAHAGSRVCWCAPVAVEQRADRARGRRPRSASAIRSATSRRPCSAAVDRAIAALVGPHHPADGGAGEARGAGVDTAAIRRSSSSSSAGSSASGSHAGLGVPEIQPQKAAERGGELVLAAAGNAGLHRLEPAGQLGDVARVAALAPRRGQRGDEGHVERAGAAEPGAGRRVGAGA